MVWVGGKKFPHTKAGQLAARLHAQRTGQTVRHKNPRPVRKNRSK